MEHAVLRVYREIDFTLRTLTPGKSVVLAFDGPGPNAKLITQVGSTHPSTHERMQWVLPLALCCVLLSHEWMQSVPLLALRGCLEILALTSGI